jgi:hypothetical protein
MKKEKIIKKLQEIYLRRLRSSYEREKIHVDTVNEFVQLFKRTGIGYIKTGYLFVKLEPIFNFVEYEEKEGKKIFDFLLFNYKSKFAILGEVKSSLTGVGKEIKSFKESRKNVLDKIDKVKEIVGDINYIEFVFCVLSTHSFDVEQYVINNDIDNIIIWNIPHLSSKEKYIECKILGNETEELKKCRRHKLPEINELLTKEKTPFLTEKIFNFLPSSSLLLKLENIVPLIYLYFKDFTFEDIDSRLFINICYNFSREERLKIFEQLINFLLEIGKIKKTKDNGSIEKDTFTFLISKNWNPENLKTRLIDWYEEFRLNQKKEEFENKVQEIEIEESRKIHKPLDQF